MSPTEESGFWDTPTSQAIDDAVLDSDTQGIVDGLRSRLNTVLSQGAGDNLVEVVAGELGGKFLLLHDTIDLDALAAMADGVRAGISYALSRGSPLGIESYMKGPIEALFASLKNQATSAVISAEPVTPEFSSPEIVDETVPTAPPAGPVENPPPAEQKIPDAPGKKGTRKPIKKPGKNENVEEGDAEESDESIMEIETETKIDTDEETLKIAQRAGLGSILEQHLRAASKYPLLTLDQEQELSRNNLAGQAAQKEKELLGETIEPDKLRELNTLIQKGNKAYDRLVCSNLKLVVTIAFGYINFGVDIEDLVAEGNTGLMRAAERFDATIGKFSTYAAWWIKQSIKRALANQGRDIRLPVHMVDKIIQMRRVANNLAEILGREPTDAEIAAEIGGKVTAKTIYEWRMIAARPVSLDAQMGTDGDGDAYGEVIADERAISADEAAMHVSDMGQITPELLAKVLDTRELKILSERFGLTGEKPKTLEEVAQGFGITRERIRQLQNIALKKLKKALEKKDTGLASSTGSTGTGSKGRKNEPTPAQTSTTKKGVVIQDITTRTIIFHTMFGERGASAMSLSELAHELGESEADVHATMIDMGIKLESRKAKTLKPKKILSRPASAPFVAQTKAQLLANSHLNNRHPVQRQILEKVLDDMLHRGITTGYIHEPARVGKTAIYIDFIRHYFNYLRADMGLGKRVFLVVPSTLLMEQVPPEIEKFFPQVSVGAYYGGEKNLDADIVVITYSSFNKLVEEGVIKPEDKECLILDEAHEALSDMRQDIIGRFTGSIRLGGTATSELGDERTVEGLLQHEYHRMSIVQAIEYGLIAPYWVIYVLTDTDLSNVAMMKGDYLDGELAKQINNTRRNNLVVKVYNQLFPGKKAIAYCGIVKHSHTLRDAFNNSGVSAISIDSSPDYEDDYLTDFRRGNYRVATNPFKLVQGFDDPEVEVILSVRPTFSPRVVGQSCPRGQTLREGKICSYLVEFIDETSGRYPLTYEEFVLRDHRKTTGDDGFTLEQLRELMYQKIKERGGLLELPKEIDGHMIASDPTQIKFLFDLRDSDRDNKLRKAGITPGNPPDDWASYAELESFANLRKGWPSAHTFKVCQQVGIRFSQTVRKYKIGNKVMEYVPPSLIQHLYAAYKVKNNDWSQPSEPFSRSRFVGALASSSVRLMGTDKPVQYSQSFTSLSESYGYDVSFFETYASMLFGGTNVRHSVATSTYEGTVDDVLLGERLREMQICEIALTDIVEQRELTMTTSMPLIAAALVKHGISLSRAQKGYIHIDHWAMIEDEVCTKK